jgi:O-antigen/teichoic acid export membrane protein
VSDQSAEATLPSATGSFLSHASISLVGNVIAAAISVAYMSILGHALTPADYGVVVAALSMGYLLSLLLSPLENGVTKLAAAFHGANEPGRLHALAFVALRRVALPCCVGLLAWWPLTYLLRRWLHVDGIGALMWLGAMCILSVPNAIIAGVMRGDHRFFDYSLARIVDSIVRLAVGIAAIHVGARAGGALAGYVVGIAAAIVFSMARLSDLRKWTPLPIEMRELVSTSLPLLFAFFFFAFSVNFDVLAAKHYLAPEQAGIYGAAATLVRMIYLAATPIYQVLFSHVTARHAQNQRTRRLTTLVAIAMAVGLFASLVIPFYFGRYILGLLFGPAYVGGAKVLLIMWLSTSLLVLEVVCVLALIGVNRTRGVSALLVPCALMAVLLLRHHATMTEIAVCSLIAVAAGTFAIAVMATSRAAPPRDS